MKNLVFLVLFTVVAAGCGGGNSTAPVSGVVTMSGSPVFPARVTFSPKGTEGSIEAAGRVASAMTEPDGSYQIDEVAVGENTVGVLMLPADEDSDEAEDNEKPAPAGKPDKTTFTVSSGTNNFDITLTPLASPGANGPGGGRVAEDDDDD